MEIETVIEDLNSKITRLERECETRRVEYLTACKRIDELEKVKQEVLETALQFRGRFLRAEKAIAKARKLMRIHYAAQRLMPGGGHLVNLDYAYAALDWRARAAPP